LLDAEAERLGGADVQAFETEGLIGMGAAASVLTYLFHRVEGRLDGRPTLLIVDEGWLVLDDPTFGAQLREWLKTLRKKNASVIFATQLLADIETSAIASAVVESCLAELTAATVAHARSQNLEGARQVADEQAGRNQLSVFLTTQQGHQPQPVQMYH
jgi:type IV secretory pathway VirB4 component